MEVLDRGLDRRIEGIEVKAYLLIKRYRKNSNTDGGDQKAKTGRSSRSVTWKTEKRSGKSGRSRERLQTEKAW
jgi:hypothetical protein